MSRAQFASISGYTLAASLDSCRYRHWSH